MSRKTVDVAFVRSQANKYLMVKETTPEFRKGVSFLLETVLRETDNYSGYNYWDSEKNPDGSLIENHDDTRRFYY